MSVTILPWARFSKSGGIMQATKVPSQPDAVVDMVRSQRNAIELIREILDGTWADHVADERVDLRYPICVPIEASLYHDQGQQSGEPFATGLKRQETLPPGQRN
jgi:hypothetical protein